MSTDRPKVLLLTIAIESALWLQAHRIPEKRIQYLQRKRGQETDRYVNDSNRRAGSAKAPR